MGWNTCTRQSPAVWCSTLRGDISTPVRQKRSPSLQPGYRGYIRTGIIEKSINVGRIFVKGRKKIITDRDSAQIDNKWIAGGSGGLAQHRMLGVRGASPSQMSRREL